MLVLKIVLTSIPVPIPMLKVLLAAEWPMFEVVSGVEGALVIPIIIVDQVLIQIRVPATSSSTTSLVVPVVR